VLFLVLQTCFELLALFWLVINVHLICCLIFFLQGFVRHFVYDGIGCCNFFRWRRLYSYLCTDIAPGMCFPWPCINLGTVDVFYVILLLVFLSQIHDICRSVSFDLNFSSYSSVLNCFGKMLNLFLRNVATNGDISGICSTTTIIPAIECLQAVRFACSLKRNWCMM